MKKVSTIGLDIAKQVFQVHGIDTKGAVVIQRRFRTLAVLNTLSGAVWATGGNAKLSSCAALESVAVPCLRPAIVDKEPF
jgi:hypothetical protein